MAMFLGFFYDDYLKSITESILGYVGGFVYTNKLLFYKFIPCENKNSENKGRSLRHFIEVVGLPYILHLDHHGKFKDGLFKKLLSKFGIFIPSLSHIHHGRSGLNLKFARLRYMHGR